MQIILALSLPRDEQTIPVSRHIAVSAMAEIGVSEDSTHDIAVALTEACTNVLNHTGPGEEFEISLDVDEESCTIRVVDKGHGFESASLGLEHADVSAEQGRGIELIRALVDQVKFIAKPEAGTIVHLAKTLDFEDGSFANPQAPNADGLGAAPEPAGETARR